MSLARPWSLGQLILFEDDAALAEAAASRVLQLGREAIQRQGFFRLLLSGGQGPRGMFLRLLDDPLALPWDKVSIYWADERWVAPRDPESNFGEAQRLFIERLQAQPQLHPMVVILDSPERSAMAYEALLKAEFASGPTAFDLCLLGMGPDGHTASLFPGSPLLSENKRLCAVARHPQSGRQRISLTLPCLNASRQILFLVGGSGKAAVLGKLSLHESGWEALPAARIQGSPGALVWMVTKQSFGGST